MANETLIRLGCFLGVFLAIALWEYLAPRRRRSLPVSSRWFNNIGLILVDALTVRVLVPVLPVSFAAAAGDLGLLNQLNLPYAAKVVAGIIALDLAIYIQHLLFHSVPVLWRLHLVHHADLDIDLTTGLRFHPIEIILSLGIKIAAIMVIGPPVAAVIIFEVLLNATSMFNHGNIRLPAAADRLLRFMVVTPDMHRVHHSVVIRETNSNFGFNLPWWDRLFGTYRAQPAAGHQDMVIGLSQFREPKRLTLGWLLALPFVGDPGEYSIDRRGREPTAGP